MRILITGGAGFIGSHLCDRFLSEGHEVIALDNFITGSPRNIAHLTDHGRFHFLQQDANQPIDIAGALDAVLHFASPASPKSYLEFPLDTMKAGSFATYSSLELARAKRARYVVASTSEVYGDPLDHPQREEYWGNVNPVGPRAVYDEAKRFAEAMTMSYRRHDGVDTRIVRIFNTYGPRNALDDGRVVPNFIGQALRGEPLTVYGDGMQTRSFCYVSDLVEGVVRLLNCEYHGPVNIGNPDEMTILEFARAVREAAGTRSDIVFVHPPGNRIVDDPSRRCPDISRARQILGWQPQVELADGLERTIRWFREQMC